MVCPGLKCKLNAEYLTPTGASGNNLSGGLKNYSTQKVITYSDSTRKIVQENVFCFYGTILNLATKMAQTFPKSDKFLFNMQTGKCLPYIRNHIFLANWYFKQPAHPYPINYPQ